MKVGITIFPEDLGYDGVIDVAMRADGKGFGEVFTVEHGFYNDTVSTAMAIACRTERITVGTGIANVYLRHPYALAGAAMAINQISNGRFVLGIGVGHAHIAAALEVPWHPPVTALQNTTDKVRAAFADAPTGAASGRVFMAAGVNIPVHWAGVGEKIARGAVNHADGLMLYLCSSQRLARIFDFVRDELEQTQRDPETLNTSLLIPTFLDRDLERARTAARDFLVLYCSFPAYAKMFRASEFGKEMDTFEERFAASDRVGAMQAISDAMLDEVCLVGDADRIVAKLDDLQAQGLQHALIAPRAIDPGTTRADMLRTVDAISEIL